MLMVCFLLGCASPRLPGGRDDIDIKVKEQVFVGGADRNADEAVAKERDTNKRNENSRRRRPSASGDGLAEGEGADPDPTRVSGDGLAEGEGADPDPIRASGALSIAAFKVGTTSFIFQIEWPLTTEFPLGKLDVLFKRSLREEEEWIILDTPTVVPEQGEAGIHIPFEQFPWYDYEERQLPSVGFFSVRVSTGARGGEGEEETEAD